MEVPSISAIVIWQWRWIWRGCRGGANMFKSRTFNGIAGTKMW